MTGRLLLAAAVAAGTVLAGCVDFSGSASSLGKDQPVGWYGSSRAAVTARLDLTLGDPATSGLGAWPPPFDAAPLAYDFDGDGAAELAAMANDTNVYVFSSQTGRVLAKLPSTLLPGWAIDKVLNGVAAGVLRPGEPPSLLVTSPGAWVAAWTFEKEGSSRDRLQFNKRWETRTNACFADASMDARPVLADADGDGALETFIQTEEVGIFALNADGTMRWKRCWGGGNAAPVVEDLDGNGRAEAVFASDAGLVAVLDAASGDVQWTFDARRHGVTPASISVAPTVAELDGVAPRELVFTARQAASADPATFAGQHLAVFAVHGRPDAPWEPELLWLRQPEWANPLSYTRLVAADVDGDGRSELFGMDWNTIGHVPGNWEVVGQPHVFRLDSQGNTVWQRTIRTWWSNKDVALLDVDRDGVPELLANGERLGTDGVWALDSRTGGQVGFISAGGWKLRRGPTLLDLQGDGALDLVLPVEPVDPAVVRGALLVIDLGNQVRPQ